MKTERGTAFEFGQSQVIKEVAVMSMRMWNAGYLLLVGLFFAGPALLAQPGQEEKKEFGNKEFDKKGFGGFGGPMGQQQRKLVSQFDKDGNGWLNQEERKAARELLKKEPDGGGFKGGFPGGPKGGGFGPGMFVTKPLLEALDADKDGKISEAEWLAGVKKFAAESDKDKRGTLDGEQIAEGINRVMPPRPGFPGGPPPGDFGPGKFLAGAILQRADTKKKGKVTAEELVMAATIFFKENNPTRSGALDEKEIGAAVSQLFPAPKGGGFGKAREPGKPGPNVSPADVKSYPEASLYEPTVLRTLFLEFENKDWEAELQDFHGTDVEVPMTLTVDGKKYPNVGVHFRGMSSYMGVQAGSKRSFNLSLDLADKKQRLYGSKTLNLLNSHDDTTFMHTALFSHIARHYMPAPKANFVKVVINGESWGVYTNAQQFNKEFIAENFKTTKGARWKVRGNPGAGAGLDYIGDNIEDYKRKYTIKSDDNAKDWRALMALCKTLSKTPVAELEKALAPILDVEGVLWFLALDNALMNEDGYWVRASDYSLYRDPKGTFHLIAHDINESFTPMGGFGPGMGMGGFGGPKGGPKGEPGGAPGAKKSPVALDPLIGSDDIRKPLRSRLLEVPSFKAKYLANVRTIAEKELDWKNLGPVVAGYRALIEKEIELDTRKLTSLAAFRAMTADTLETAGVPEGKGPPMLSLRAFADQRREYLLNHPSLKK